MPSNAFLVCAVASNVLATECPPPGTSATMPGSRTVRPQGVSNRVPNTAASQGTSYAPPASAACPHLCHDAWQPHREAPGCQQPGAQHCR
eukprot:366402-Chlamydomonas_euryale.AAC.3